MWCSTRSTTQWISGGGPPPFKFHESRDILRGTTRAYNEQVTGRRIPTIDDTFARLATKYPVNATHTRH